MHTWSVLHLELSIGFELSHVAFLFRKCAELPPPSTVIFPTLRYLVSRAMGLAKMIQRRRVRILLSSNVTIRSVYQGRPPGYLA